MNWEGVVYDLDGTLVKLEVDWVEVRDAVAERLHENGVDSKDASLWDMLDIGERENLEDEVEEVIRRFECEGAENSKVLPSTDILKKTDGTPVGVCSLNAEEACRVALETHGVSGKIKTVVGRDSVEERKPDPRPLLVTLDRMDIEPCNAVFVGDSNRDGVCAERANVDFYYVDEWLSRFSR